MSSAFKAFEIRVVFSSVKTIVTRNDRTRPVLFRFLSRIHSRNSFSPKAFGSKSSVRIPRVTNALFGPVFCSRCCRLERRVRVVLPCGVGGKNALVDRAAARCRGREKPAYAVRNESPTDRTKNRAGQFHSTRQTRRRIDHSRRPAGERVESRRPFCPAVGRGAAAGETLGFVVPARTIVVRIIRRHEPPETTTRRNAVSQSKK